jgi:signal transduction histidine kinase
MLTKLRRNIDRLLKKLKLKPLSLAQKCRLMFGSAVIFSLVLALLIPFFWMSKLTDKIALDSGGALANVVYEKHFQLDGESEKGLPVLNDVGSQIDSSHRSLEWIDLREYSQQGDEKPQIDEASLLEKHLLSNRQLEGIKRLQTDPDRIETSWTVNSVHNYLRIVRATESCIACHNPNGTAMSFNLNEVIGAIVVQTPARDISRVRAMNRLWIIVAGLLAGLGAMIAFYAIVQRIILRPIRQLRALVNNISEGNLNARSSIRSGDEYERLSSAFNNMLDGLQDSQEKLRQANRRLDAKIAQLSDRNIELFKANKLKSEFLANISHEFRTPLNAILGFAELLKEKPADNAEKSRRYAQNIVTSGRNLLNMINDLLDLAKAEAGKMTLRIERTSIHELFDGLTNFFAPLWQEKMIDLKVDIADDIPILSTDSGKLQQILYNLLSNAIKFTPERGRVEIIAKMADEKNVVISVIDTGPGIRKDDQKHIFEKFRQIDGSITRGGSGTGLGLAICSELTNMLAGSIWVESEPGSGATFKIELPVELVIEKNEQQED